MGKGKIFETIFFKTMALREWEARGIRGWEGLGGWGTERLRDWEAEGLGG